jgi:small subunit ribosomal protein S19
MSRSLKKGPFCDEKLLKKVIAAKQSNTAVKTWSRSSTILPEFVGVKVQIHNGRIFIEILVTEDMVGHKLGEFSPTHTFKKHGGKNA